MLHRARAALLTTVLLASLAHPAAAHSEVDMSGLALPAALTLCAIEVGGAIPVWGSAAALADGEAPAAGWIVSNFVLGTTHTIAGAALLGQDDLREDPLMLSLGIVTLAIGLTNYGLGIAGLVYEPVPGAGSLTVSPLALPTKDGGFAPGVGLTIAGF